MRLPRGVMLRERQDQPREETDMAKGMDKKKETKKKPAKTQKEKRADKAAKKG